MDGTVPKEFYNFYLNFMNFLIFLNSRGPGSKFQISSGGARPLVRGARPPGPPGSYASGCSSHFTSGYISKCILVKIQAFLMTSLVSKTQTPVSISKPLPIGC